MLETDNLARFGGSKSHVIRFFERLDYSISEFKCDHSIDLLCIPVEKLREFDCLSGQLQQMFVN